MTPFEAAPKARIKSTGQGKARPPWSAQNRGKADQRPARPVAMPKKGARGC